MLVHIIKPSSVEAELIKADRPADIVVIRPRRWSAKQQVLSVASVDVVNDKNEVIDSVVLNVNQKTGRLQMLRIGSEELKLDADAKAQSGKE